MKRLGLCTSLALYNLNIPFIQKKENLKNIFYYVEEWFNTHNHPPLRMDLSGENIAHSTKTKTFKHYKKIIEKNNFEEIEYFWMGAPPSNHDDDCLDSLLSCELNLNGPHNAFTFYFHNDVISHNWEYIEKIIKQLSKWGSWGYGIAYQREFSKSPLLYNHGVIVGSDNKKNDPLIEKEEENISKWMHVYGDPNRYKLGDLRDIYPLNFLSKKHLERPIDKGTLKTWIESSPDHGNLSPLTDELWTWHVPEDKISSVREALRPTGYVLCI